MRVGQLHARFNSDKAFDQFLMEQIAGDELVDYEHAKVITPEIVEKLVATGFLRMAPDGISANPVNRVEDRLEVIADEIDIFPGTVSSLEDGTPGRNDIDTAIAHIVVTTEPTRAFPIAA